MSGKARINLKPVKGSINERRPRAVRPIDLRSSLRRDPIGMIGSMILRIGLSSPTARGGLAGVTMTGAFGAVAFTTRFNKRS